MMAEPVEIESKEKRILGLSFRAACAWILGILLLACGIVVRVAPMSMHVRALLAGTLIWFVFTLTVSLISVIAKRPGWIFPTIFFVTLIIVWAILGSKPPDVEGLRGVYYKRLHDLVGTPYAVGGETDLGIDAPGLARMALWNAMVREGIKEANPRLLGKYLWKFWWRDMSASDIDQGRYGYTIRIGRARMLAGYDTSKLKIGDMAISQDGDLMVYYGKGQWIWASTYHKKVIVEKPRRDSRLIWFNTPVKLVRWRILDQK